MVSNAECKYQTSSVDSETGEEIITDHWVTDWEYEEGEKVEIRTKAIPDGWRFTEWRAQDPKRRRYVIYTYITKRQRIIF